MQYISQPKISVVTVTFNSIQSLQETINSVLGQTYENKEYVIVDGNSSDGTKEFLGSYRNKIRWVSEPDEGIYDAMNKALSMATGDFVIFLGADDHFLSYSTLKEATAYMNDPNAVYYGNVFRSSRNDIYKGKFNKYKLSLENICHQSIFYPRAVYKTNKYNLKYNVYADYYYNLSIYPLFKFVYIPKTICYYNYDGFSSLNKDVEFEKIVNQFVRQQNGCVAYLLRLLYLLYKRLRLR